MRGRCRGNARVKIGNGYGMRGFSWMTRALERAEAAHVAANPELDAESGGMTWATEARYMIWR